MKPVVIHCQDVASISGSDRCVTLELNMTRRQEREAVFEILGAWPEKDVHEWILSEFPELFSEVES